MQPSWFKVAEVGKPIRVMVEQGKKKAVAVALDWPGRDRSGKSGGGLAAPFASGRIAEQAPEQSALLISDLAQEVARG